MKNDKEESNKLPDEFSSYEEAGEFWDSHDSTEFLDQMTPVDMKVHFETRHFEIEVDEDIIALLRQRALSEHLPISSLASDLLRKELVVN
jgi:CopG antitoxin of type II toxin-antitoxin system